jgi:hypothetical protein
VPGGGRPAEEEITMRYLALLGADESAVPAPGTPERAEIHAGYVRFAQLAADAIIAGEALQPVATARTVRHGDGGEPLVTEGPYAETTEALAGFYVLEADTLDDAIALAREIPSARNGWVAVRPLVMWQADPGTATPGPRHLALIYGKEAPGDQPGTPEWDAGAAEHGRFAEAAGQAIVAGGAVHPIDTTTTVRVRDGELLVTDGPFSETAEVVGGLYLLAAPDDEAAVALAAQIPVGPGGAVEVRPVADMGDDVRAQNQ